MLLGTIHQFVFLMVNLCGKFSSIEYMLNFRVPCKTFYVSYFRIRECKYEVAYQKLTIHIFTLKKHLFVCFCLFACLSFYLSVCFSVCLFQYLSVLMSVCFNVCLFICVCVCMPVCLWIVFDLLRVLI